MNFVLSLGGRRRLDVHRVRDDERREIHQIGKINCLEKDRMLIVSEKFHFPIDTKPKDFADCDTRYNLEAISCKTQTEQVDEAEQT
jgi:hypothetical protein